MARYKDLIVWHKAMELAETVYTLVKGFPAAERHALSEQMRRAAVSIPSNIAEGHSRASAKEFKRFPTIACGSLAELETQIELARRFGFIGQEEADSTISLSQEVDKMIWSLAKNIVVS